MAFKDTMQILKEHLEQVDRDLIKVAKGNKAASQRVRTATLRLEKIGKAFRKESLTLEKKGKPKKASRRKLKSKFFSRKNTKRLKANR